jgi:hypothetical protein
LELYQESILKVKPLKIINIVTKNGQWWHSTDRSKALEKLYQKNARFLQSIICFGKQLEDLRFDLVKKYINQEQFQDYIAREKVIIGNFSRKLFHSFIPQLLFSLAVWSLYPKMNIIIGITAINPISSGYITYSLHILWIEL